jgi:ABC-type nitrate/sulfonate/bicarbonate transport system permease component
MEPQRSSSTIPLGVRILVPVGLGLAFLAGWEILVDRLEIPKFVLPAPSMIAQSLIGDFATLAASLWITLRVTIAAFITALVLGVLFAIVFARSRILEISLFPYAVILQVTQARRRRLLAAPLARYPRCRYRGADAVHRRLVRHPVSRHFGGL